MPKLAECLTNLEVKKAKPKDKAYTMAAGCGLHLLVKTDGSKHWQFRFRFDGKQSTIEFGCYPEVSLTHAKQLATGSLELLANVIKSSKNKKPSKIPTQGLLVDSFELVAI
jgi:hypothetical protein